MKTCRSSRFNALVALLALGLPSAFADPVTHWSSRTLNSNEYIRSAEYPATQFGTVKDFSGQATQGGAAGGRNFGYSVPGGGFVIRTETSDVFARADLSTGELKARASLGLSGNLAGSTGATPAFGERAATARADAAMADRFTLGSGGLPYIWPTGGQFTFTFSVDGLVDIPAEFAAPTSSSWMNWASLRFNVYRIGGLQAIEDLAAFDFFAYGMANGFGAANVEFNRLIGEVNSRSVTRTGWCLGENLTLAGFCGGSGFTQVDLGAEPSLLSFSFDPGGDFEWIASLEVDVAVDLAYENLAVGLDFSNTVTAGFVAPDGVTVTSASALFPGTTGITAAVPEPATLALLLAGLAGIGWHRRSALSPPASRGAPSR